MATRRDQLQSYQFLLQRVVSALVYRKTDPAQSPFRRAGGAVFAGVMISILALAVTAVIGLFAQGFGKAKDWTKGEAIVFNEDTGAQYVVYPPSGKMEDLKMPQRLYPVLNFSSAALLVGTTEVINVDNGDLTGDDVPPRGMPIGIPNAPDSLPTADDMLTGGWSVCNKAPENTNGSVPTSYALVGKQPTAGTPLGDQALSVTVSEPENKQYVVWNNHKFDVTDDEPAKTALGLGSNTPDPVDPAFLQALPDGAKLQVPVTSDAVGDPTNVDGLSDRKIGDVLQVGQGAEATYYVVKADQTASITETQAYLQIAYTHSTEFIQVQSPPPGSGDLKPSSSDPASPPEARPTMTSAGSAACATYNAKGENSNVLTDAAFDATAGIETPEYTENNTVLADKVIVTPGMGALVRSGTPEAEGGALVLVTDTGNTFPIDGTEVSKALALDEGKAVNVFSEIVSLLPEGVALSVEAAQASALGKNQ